MFQGTKLILLFVFFLVSLKSFAAMKIGEGTSPSLSPDRTKIAFVERVDSRPVFLVKRTASGEVLYKAPVDVFKASFDSNSNLLAAVTNKQELLVINLATREVQNRFALTDQGFQFIREDFELSGLLAQRQAIEFSPDSKFISLQLSSYACDYPKPNRVALVDLEKNTVRLRPGEQMTGDLEFAHDSKALYVYDICGNPNTVHRWKTSMSEATESYLPVGKLGWGVYSAGLAIQGQHVLRLSEGSQWYLSRVGVFNSFTLGFTFISQEMNFGPKIVTSRDFAQFLISGDGKLLHFDGKNAKLLSPETKPGAVLESSTTDFAANSNWTLAAAMGADLRGGRYFMIWDLASGKLVKQASVGSELKKGQVIQMSIFDENAVEVFWRDRETNSIWKTLF